MYVVTRLSFLLTLLWSEDAAGLCICGHVDLVVQLLQDLLVHLDLGVRDLVLT